MRTATFSVLRNNAKKYFDLVEKGEAVEVFRHGKPVAVIEPIAKAKRGGWERAVPLRIPGVSLSRMVVEERKKAR